MDEPSWDRESLEEDWGAFGASIRSNYEEKAVKQVLAAIGAPGLASRIASAAKQRTGTASVTFPGLEQQLPRLPYLFRVSPKLKYVRTVTVERLLNGFTKTPFVEAFRDVCDEFDDDDDIARVVLLFPWPTVKRGRFMAVHTADCGCVGDVLISKVMPVKRLGRVAVHLSRLSLLLTDLDGKAVDDYR